MLKKRIIPTLLWKNLGLVKGKKFNSWRRVGAALPFLKIYNSRDVDELFLLDITATNENRKPDEFLIKSLSKENTVPFCVGGGINKISQIEQLLSSGADKICINTAAFKNINFVKEAVKNFGSQCIVVSIDYKKINNKKFCFTNSGTVKTDEDPIKWAMKMEDQGCGEILFTSIDLEGTLLGYDYDYINSLTNKINIPIIVNGGAGKLEDFYKLFCIPKVSGSAAASIFHFTETTPKMIKDFLIKKKIPVRDMFVNQD